MLTRNFQRVVAGKFSALVYCVLIFGLILSSVLSWIIPSLIIGICLTFFTIHLSNRFKVILYGLDFMEKIDQAIESATDQESLIGNVFKAILSPEDWQFVTFWTLDKSSNKLNVLRNMSLNAEVFEAAIKKTLSSEFGPGVGLPGQVFKSKKPVWVKCIKGEGNFPRKDSFIESGLVCGIAFPVLVDQEFMGVIELFSNRKIASDRVWEKLLLGLGKRFGQAYSKFIVKSHAEDSDSKLKMFLGSINMGLWEMDIVSGTLTWDPGMFKLFGVEENSGKTPSEVWRHSIHLEDQLNTKEAYSKALGESTDLFLKFRIIDPLGEVRYLCTKAYAHRNEVGEPIKFIGVTWDITEEERSRVSLLAEKSRYTTLINGLNTCAGVVVTNKAGAIIFANEKYCKMTGYSHAQAISRNQRFLKSGLHSKEYYGELWDTISSGKVWHGETCNRNKNGELYWIDQTIVPLQKPDGGTQFVSIQFDITERKAAAEKVRLATKLSSLGEMAAGVAHEINNPLAVILGKAEKLIQASASGEVAPKYAEDLEKVRRMTLRIASIVKGLKTFSRNGDKDPFAPVELRSLIEDSLSLCQERFRLHGVNLQVGPIPSFQIECRATQISQVLINLLNNSYDAISGLPEKWIKLNFDVVGNVVQISVTDSGSGIPSNIADKLMEPFFTTKGVGRGTGLGLSISRGIAQEHGGSLVLDRNSKNTRFILELPLSHADTKAA